MVLKDLELHSYRKLPLLDHHMHSLPCRLWLMVRQVLGNLFPSLNTRLLLQHFFIQRCSFEAIPKVVFLPLYRIIMIGFQLGIQRLYVLQFTHTVHGAQFNPWISPKILLLLQLRFGYLNYSLCCRILVNEFPFWNMLTQIWSVSICSISPQLCLPLWLSMTICCLIELWISLTLLIWVEFLSWFLKLLLFGPHCLKMNIKHKFEMDFELVHWFNCLMFLLLGSNNSNLTSIPLLEVVKDIYSSLRIRKRRI